MSWICWFKMRILRNFFCHYLVLLYSTLEWTVQFSSYKTKKSWRVIPDTQRPDKNPITSSFTVLFPDASQLAGGKPICGKPPSIHPPSESNINYCCFELNNIVRFFFSTKHILHSIIILFSEWLTSHRLSKYAAFDRANCAAMQQLARKGISSWQESSLTAVQLTPDFLSSKRLLQWSDFNNMKCLLYMYAIIIVLLSSLC